MLKEITLTHVHTCAMCIKVLTLYLLFSWLQGLHIKQANSKTKLLHFPWGREKEGKKVEKVSSQNTEHKHKHTRIFTMSLGYAEKLSYIEDVGNVGMAEYFEPPHVLQQKVGTFDYSHLIFSQILCLFWFFFCYFYLLHVKWVIFCIFNVYDCYLGV